MNWMDWYNGLEKPDWTPAPSTIGLIWQILYPIIFVSFGFVCVQWLRKKLPGRVLLPFAINLAANLAFTPIQFGLRNLPLATLDILIVWITIIWMSSGVWKHYRWVALAQIPYFVWVSIATILQVSITLSNPGRDTMALVSLLRPSEVLLQTFLDAQRPLPFTYECVGATLDGTRPPGYAVNHTRIPLGAGAQAFASARAALERWQQFRLGWVEPFPGDTPIRAGEVVAILARVGGLWLRNACRIVDVIDEPSRFGFAYGTLPGHLESGEERFLIEWNQGDDSVWYEILAYSRPHSWLAKLGYPFARWQQRRFGRDCLAAMQRSVAGRLSGVYRPAVDAWSI